MAKNDFRVTSIFKIIIRICMFSQENIEVFTQKVSVHFLFFYLNEKELNQQVFLIKYVENEISTATSHKEKKRERGAKTIQL